MFANERRASRRALLPLLVMASVFVLPTYRACSDEPLQSPAQFAADDALTALWVAPSFLVAGFLAFLTFRALRRKEVDLTTRRLGLVSIAGVALTSLGGLVLTTELLNSPWPIALVAVALAAGALLLRRARGRPGFQVWERLLAAFSLVAATSGPALVLSGALLFDERNHVGPGAWLFVGAAAALLFVTLGAVAQQPRSR